MKLPSVHIYLHDTYQREKFLREQLLPYVEKKILIVFFLLIGKMVHILNG